MRNSLSLNATTLSFTKHTCSFKHQPLNADLLYKHEMQMHVQSLFSEMGSLSSLHIEFSLYHQMWCEYSYPWLFWFTDYWHTEAIHV